MKILLVDDSEFQRSVQRKILEDHEVSSSDIIEADNGLAGLSMATSNSDLGLIISDWNMPEKTGLEFVSELRNAGIDVPVVMVTSESNQEKMVRAYENGVNGFINKPISPESLWQAVNIFI